MSGSVFVSFKKDFYEYISDKKNMIFFNTITGQLHTLEDKLLVYEKVRSVIGDSKEDFFQYNTHEHLDYDRSDVYLDELFRNAYNILEVGLYTNYKVGIELSKAVDDAAASLVNMTLIPIDNFVRYHFSEKGENTFSSDNSEYVVFYAYFDPSECDWVAFDNITYESFEDFRCG